MVPKRHRCPPHHREAMFDCSPLCPVITWLARHAHVYPSDVMFVTRQGSCVSCPWITPCFAAFLGVAATQRPRRLESDAHQLCPVSRRNGGACTAGRWQAGTRCQAQPSPMRKASTKPASSSKKTAASQLPCQCGSPHPNHRRQL